EYFARSQIAAGGLPDALAGGVVRIGQGAIALNWDAFTHPGYGEMRKAKRLSPSEQWFRFAEMLYVYRQGAEQDHHNLQGLYHDAWRLFQLAQPLGLSAEDIRGLSGGEAKALLAFLDDLPPAVHGPIWLEAYETHYRDQLFTLLSGNRKPTGRKGRPQAQIIFCLDMREEGIRRHVEAQNVAYETFGTAGFFTMPMIFRSLATGIGKPSCPIPIDPRHTVVEEVRPGQGPREARHEYRAKRKQALHSMYHRLETNLVTAYFLIDFLGVLFGITTAARTMLPRKWRALTVALREKLIPSVQTSLRVERPTEEEAREVLAARERDRILDAVLKRTRGRLPSDALPTKAIEELRLVALAGDRQHGQTQVARLLDLSRADELALIDELRENGLDPRDHAAQLAEFRMLGFSPEEQADLVEAQLRMIGLTYGFARLVLFCGHGSTTENNPYAAAYHCGACGGNRGGPNARAIATMLNTPAVRSLLRQRGIEIPDDTYFVRAEHDTAADRFTYFDTEDIPLTHRKEFQRLTLDLYQACGRHAQERCRRLPLAPKNPTPEQALRHVQSRALDWAQVYPEWGHAMCAVMLIGRRELSRGLFLDRRTYLQSYDPDQDPDGAILEEIMAAFIPVVRGINLDYYFSYIDSGINGVFGAGTKAIHNVVGLIGVMQGAGSDLKPGLPAQGVAPLHEPMRAHIIVESPPAKVTSIVERYKVLENLFKNQWAHLVAWDPQTRQFMRYQPDGGWETLRAGEGS
ncbi:MAG: putative inorganic carbon transporter subunit DabA, partial [Candidatus Methylomirabilis sp.]